MRHQEQFHIEQVIGKKKKNVENDQRNIAGHRWEILQKWEDDQLERR